MNVLSSPEKNKAFYRWAFALGALASLGILLYGALWFAELSERQAREQQLREDADRALAHLDQNFELDRLTELMVRAKAFGYDLSGLGYHGLYQRWRDVRHEFDQILDAKGNHYLAADVGERSGKVMAKLLELRDQCSSVLRQEDLANSPEVLWKVYNLRACVSVMVAYHILEFAEDGPKSQKFLGDAVDDFKQAIFQVDLSGAPAYAQTLPRWNLEMMMEQSSYLSISQGGLTEEKLEEVRARMEVVMPNVGGYSPGAPLETRVRK